MRPVEHAVAHDPAGAFGLFFKEFGLDDEDKRRAIPEFRIVTGHWVSNVPGDDDPRLTARPFVCYSKRITVLANVPLVRRLDASYQSAKCHMG